MHAQKNDLWNNIFDEATPLFWPIVPAYRQQDKPVSWPQLSDYNQLLDNCTNKNSRKIVFVSQGTYCDTFEKEYEPRIYTTGEVQTRLNNWHDFFQVMVWKTFPKTKSLLNEIHYKAATNRHKTKTKQRGPKENFVTLFDECGSVVVSSKESILAMVKNFEWNDFFIKNKSEFGNTIDCIVFGHAMYEKALKPYIGMTSHCLLLLVEDSFFKLNTEQKTHYMDDALSKYISKIENLNTKCLTPLPILGIPNWHPNQSVGFYENTSYFRSGRKKT